MLGKDVYIPTFDEAANVDPRPSAPPITDDDDISDTDTNLPEGQLNEDESRSTDPTNGIECPVCMDPINPNDSAMRCRGDAGVCHLFHARCLTPWLETCRTRNTIASCPVCRGPVQVHKRRLQQFLESDEAVHLGQENRGMLGSLLDTVNERMETMADGWTTDLTTENLLAGVSVMASAAYGFYTGYTGRNSYLTDQMLWHHATRTMTVANVVGYALGVGLKIWKSNSESDSRRSRNSNSNSDSNSSPNSNSND